MTAVADLTGGQGAEVVLDFVAEQGAENDGFAMTRRAGSYFVIGYGGTVTIPTLDIISTERNIIGNIVGTYNDLAELMVLAQAGKVTLYLARDGTGRVVGAAFETVAPDGYSGNIYILVGMDRDGRVHAIRVTNHHETPGLGDGIVKNHKWVNSFAGKGLTGTRWAVKKDGGDFDQFTGATISPRAVVKAVKKALEFYQRHEAQIAAADHPTEGGA